VVLQKLSSSAPTSSLEAEEREGEVEEDKMDTATFHELDKDQQLQSSIAYKEEQTIKNLFRGLSFMLGREVPQESLEFVILCGGGEVFKEGNKPTPLIDQITHFVGDRSFLKHTILNREYVQPQWVYDAFNLRVLIPTQHYAQGVAPPAHLSPFVDDEAEGYIPKQKMVLQQWKALGSKMLQEHKETNDTKTRAEQANSEAGIVNMKDDENDENDEKDAVYYANALEKEKKIENEKSNEQKKERKEEDEEIEVANDEDDDNTVGIVKDSDDEDDQDVGKSGEEKKCLTKEKHNSMMMVTMMMLLLLWVMVEPQARKRK